MEVVRASRLPTESTIPNESPQDGAPRRRSSKLDEYYSKVEDVRNIQKAIQSLEAVHRNISRPGGSLENSLQGVKDHLQVAREEMNALKNICLEEDIYESPSESSDLIGQFSPPEFGGELPSRPLSPTRSESRIRLQFERDRFVRGSNELPAVEICGKLSGKGDVSIKAHGPIRITDGPLTDGGNVSILVQSGPEHEKVVSGEQKKTHFDNASGNSEGLDQDKGVNASPKHADGTRSDLVTQGPYHATFSLLIPTRTDGKAVRESQMSLPYTSKISGCREIEAEEHPDILTSMAILASTLRKQGRWQEAETLGLQVMERRQRVLGLEHPDTLASMSDLASTYRDQGRWGNAEGLDKLVMETSMRVLGNGHPHTLTSMENLALTYMKQGRWNEAEDLAGQVMEKRLVQLQRS